MVILKMIVIGSLFLTSAMSCLAQENLLKQQRSLVEDDNASNSSSGVRSLLNPQNEALVFSSNVLSSESGQFSEEQSWIVNIRTTGGFLGKGRGSLVINSEGNAKLNKNGIFCALQIPTRELQSLSEKVASLKLVSKGNENHNFCLDCFVTTLILYRRESDGVVRRYSFSWNVTNYAEVPDDVKQVYENALKLTGRDNKH